MLIIIPWYYNGRKRFAKLRILILNNFNETFLTIIHLGRNSCYSIFFPGRRMRAPFTKSCNEMRPPYWLLYSTNQ
jgi:hypothetical protein